METCLKDYFSAITEENSEDMVIGKKSISANGNADLIVFNGHNGLLEYHVKRIRFSYRRTINYGGKKKIK